MVSATTSALTSGFGTATATVTAASTFFPSPEELEDDEEDVEDDPCPTSTATTGFLVGVVEVFGFLEPEDGFLEEDEGFLLEEEDGFLSVVEEVFLEELDLVPRAPVDLDREVVFLVEDFFTSAETAGAAGAVTATETAAALGLSPPSEDDDEEEDNITAASAGLSSSFFGLVFRPKKEDFLVGVALSPFSVLDFLTPERGDFGLSPFGSFGLEVFEVFFPATALE